MSISSRWKQIHHKIQSHVPYREIRTIAVSKYHPEDKIKEAYQLGLRNFGESYIQEAVAKIEALKSLDDISWHFIGPIQSNKTRQIANHFDWVQSVSREKIAIKLSQYRPSDKPPLNVLVQVNVSGDPAKSGANFEQAEILALKISNLHQLCFRGIMCIPALYDNQNELEQDFNKMKSFYDHLKSRFKHVDTLSMGMSNDYVLALEQGSNMIRIGTALFGKRY